MRLRDGDKEKIEGLLTQLSDAEAEISLLRRKIQNLEEEVNRLKKENHRLHSELQKARTVNLIRISIKISKIKLSSKSRKQPTKKFSNSKFFPENW